MLDKSAMVLVRLPKLLFFMKLLRDNMEACRLPNTLISFLCCTACWHHMNIKHVHWADVPIITSFHDGEMVLLICSAYLRLTKHDQPLLQE